VNHYAFGRELVDVGRVSKVACVSKVIEPEGIDRDQQNIMPDKAMYWVSSGRGMLGRLRAEGCRDQRWRREESLEDARREREK